jgi:hypothetical protein
VPWAAFTSCPVIGGDVRRSVRVITIGADP